MNFNNRKNVKTKDKKKENGGQPEKRAGDTNPDIRPIMYCVSIDTKLTGYPALVLGRIFGQAGNRMLHLVGYGISNQIPDRIPDIQNFTPDIWSNPN